MKNVESRSASLIQKQMLSTGELAELCHLTKHTIIAAIEKGELRASRTPGGHNRIRREDALGFMRRHNLLPREAIKIVVVDNEAFVHDLLEQVIDRSGCKIFQVNSAYDAGRIVERERPNLIVLNLNVPGLTGEEIDRHISAEGYGKKCGILGIEAADAENHKDSEASIPHLLETPFNILQLKEEVERLLTESCGVEA